MGPTITPVECSATPPVRTSVVVIGGGIVGLSAALTLSERGVPVVVLEKGGLAGEQSSRNLGWIRKMGRSVPDLPLAIAAERLWEDMAQRVGVDVGYRRSGILYLARTDAEMEAHRRWLDEVSGAGFDSRLVSPADIDAIAPGGIGEWRGGLHTPSDGRGEPTLAASAIANAAIANGAVVIKNCAVRSLSRSAGRVDGVVTERGTISCDRVLLAGGLWSRRFLGNLGIALPTLPLIASVIRTAPMDGPTDVAVGGPDFSFRRRLDGGYTISHRGALGAPLLPDHLLIGHRYLPVLRKQHSVLRLSIGRPFLRDLALARRWKPNAPSPFERVRTDDPQPDEAINAEALRNLAAAWPSFGDAKVEQSWAGAMDVTPDSLPVMGEVEAIPGLVLATGFSGHGFGTSPAAGRLAADLLEGGTPLVDPTPYRLDRFERRGA